MKSDPVISLYRGWDAFEKSLGQYGAYVLDFDLAPGQYGDSFSSRWQVLNRLTEYRDAFSEDTEADTLIKAKLNASIYYLRVVMGENVPFKEYVENTMGISPRTFSDSYIEELRQKIDQILSRWDMKYDRRFADTFYESFRLQDFYTFKEDVEQLIRIWYERIGHYLELPPMPKIHMHFVNKAEFWHTWLSGFAPEGTTLEINTNPDLRYQFIKSEPLRLTTHELCGHALHMAVLFDRIEKGELSAAHGLILVHGPEIVQIEGLGQMLPELAGDVENDFDDLARATRMIYRHRFLVLNNAYIWLAEGRPVREVFNYAIEHLHFYSPEYVEKELRLWSHDPSMRAYRYIQAVSEELFRQIATRLSEQQKRDFLRKMYTTPMTAGQIEEWANLLIQDIPGK